MAFPKRDKYNHELQRLSDKCRALGYPGRLHLLQCLTDKDMYVHDLVNQMPLTQGAVSEHLRKLRETGIIEVRVNGLYNEYSFDIQRLIEVKDLLEAFIEKLIGKNRESGDGAGASAGDEAA